MPTQAEIVAKYAYAPLKDQIAIVTGANSGIGEGVARYLGGLKGIGPERCACWCRIVAFSQTDFTPDLKSISVPTLVMRGS